MPKIIAISISDKKGIKKTNVESANVIANFGIEGDAHAGDWHRQISLLAIESINKMRDKGFDVKPGDFAENITTEGLDLVSLSVGTKLQIGSEVLLEITQIGKECHQRCAIYYQTGDCIMPKEGIFAKVISGGKIEVGNEIRIIQTSQVSKTCEVFTVAILTISDRASKGIYEDTSGKTIKEIIETLQFKVVKYEIIPDEKDEIIAKLKSYCDIDKVDLVLTTGGTGLAPRDITPEATLEVIERLVPGIPEAMRYESMKIVLNAMLSRMVAGIRGSTLIINLPGSTKAVKENLNVVLPVIEHAIRTVRGEVLH